VGFAVDLFAFMETLAENEGICERGAAGCDVDGSAPSEVEGGEVEQPAVSVTKLASAYYQ
jgi:hypothetical protein